MALLAHRATHRPSPRIAVLALILTLGSMGWIGLGQAQPQLYRWVDEKGEVHYTDQVPPSQADKARTRLSEDGVTVESVPRAPTEEEIEQAREEERRRVEEAKQRADQLAADEKLLKTYRTIEDLELSRNGKIAAIESLIQVKRDGVRAETQNLLKINAELKALEGAGKPIPTDLMDKIDLSVVRIREGYAEVVDNEYRKQDIRNEFERIVTHYRKLKRLPPAEEPKDDAEAVLKLSILVSCKGEEQCLRYWERAVGYVRKHSDKKKEVAGTGLLIAFQQDDREDRSLTLSWTQKGPDRPVHLYLDVQCKNKLTASLYCVNPTIPQIRDGFQESVVLEGEEGG
ncbi:DUF4124 domain-containing protein [Thiocystis violacea]|uniref:DUF4124 domain-containing protein n=1 Tax=Thiocystis violacea TaxID=13725 RepID=UPI00190900A7|nr:DUF4124 domain-containing protein [Thiocystis violacea]